MQPEELVNRIGRFPQWYYQFELSGHKTPLRHADSAIRHPQRRAYFFDALVELLGGSLAGKRVLDLGCNEGFFSLAAVESQCDFVLGIDGQSGSIEQARLVFQAKGVAPDRHELRCGDLFDALASDIGSFDLVLALGILHWFQFTDHIRFLEAVARVNTDLLIIDTVVSSRRGALLELRGEPLGERDPRRGDRLSILPSRRALLEMMRRLGYAGAVLKPRFTDWTGSDDYRDGVRRAFLFARQTSLDRLSAPVERLDRDAGPRGLEDVSGKALLRALVAKTTRALGLGKR